MYLLVLKGVQNLNWTLMGLHPSCFPYFRVKDKIRKCLLVLRGYAFEILDENNVSVLYKNAMTQQGLEAIFADSVIYNNTL